ncbi:VOC family protein [Aurantivibrio infirmus]
MELGNFSVSLAVKNLQISKSFYEALGFSVFGGDEDQNWLIMKNGDSVVGLFQGMFDNNMLTFNPGWDQNCKNLNSFDDVRDIQKHIKAQGLKPSTEVDENSQGPGSIMISDPDGNMILIDQHV